LALECFLLLSLWRLKLAQFRLPIRLPRAIQESLWPRLTLYWCDTWVCLCPYASVALWWTHRRRDNPDPNYNYNRKICIKCKYF
jgi:hypothetical protein